MVNSIFKEDLFKGKIALVTGGGTGIGLRTAKELSQLGADLILASRKKDNLDKAVDEIEKLGGQVKITQDSLQLLVSKNSNKNVNIETYNDHRMAMAFAPLALKKSIVINDAEVVSKSYPNFWNDLKTLGFQLTEIMPH